MTESTAIVTSHKKIDWFETNKHKKITGITIGIFLIIFGATFIPSYFKIDTFHKFINAYQGATIAVGVASSSLMIGGGLFSIYLDRKSAREITETDQEIQTDEDNNYYTIMSRRNSEPLW